MHAAEEPPERISLEAGQRWNPLEAPLPAPRSHGPWRIWRAVQRVLDPEPARRWTDAKSFHGALRYLAWLPR